MQIDWTINVGHLVTSFGIIAGFVAAWYTVKSDIRNLDTRIEDVETVVRDQIAMNAKMIAEIAAVRQDVAVIRDRLEPPPISVQSPSKGGPG